MAKATTMEGRPAKMGFRMPAEWEPHEQCWMGWPVRTSPSSLSLWFLIFFFFCLIVLRFSVWILNSDSCRAVGTVHSVEVVLKQVEERHDDGSLEQLMSQVLSLVEN